MCRTGTPIEMTAPCPPTPIACCVSEVVASSMKRPRAAVGTERKKKEISLKKSIHSLQDREQQQCLARNHVSFFLHLVFFYKIRIQEQENTNVHLTDITLTEI